MLAATVRVTRDLDAAEEAVQDAYVQAPNAMRRSKALETKLPLLVEPEHSEAPEPRSGEESATTGCG